MKFLLTGILAAFCFTGTLEAKDFKFAFGNPEIPPPPGYVKVSGKQIYNQNTGYGWVKRCAYDTGPFENAKSEETKTACECEPQVKEAQFRVDLPDGIYQVKAYLGHVIPTEGRKVCLAINNKILIQPPGAGGWGMLATPTVPAVVTDGKMDLMFYADEKGRIAVFALEISEVKDKSSADKLKQKFDDAPEYKASGNSSAKNIPASQKLFSISGKPLIETGHHPEQIPGAWLEKYKNTAALIYTRPNQGEILDYSIPKERELLSSLSSFSTSGEKCSLYMGLYAVKELKDVKVSISELKNGNASISPDNIKIFNVTCHPQSTTDRTGNIGQIVPELFEKSVPFSLPEGKTQPLYLLFSIPKDIPAGIYKGEFSVLSGSEKVMSSEVLINILNLKLNASVDKTWLICPDVNRWLEMKQETIDAEIRDMVEHGINGFKMSFAPVGGAFIEEKGKIITADFGKIGKAIASVKKYVSGKPEIVLAATNMLASTVLGWKLQLKGNAEKSFAENEGRRSLILKNNDNDAISSISNGFFGFMDGGQTLNFKIRYRLDAKTKALAEAFFYDTRRTPIKPSKLQLALLPSGGNFTSAEGSVTLPENAANYRIEVTFKGAGTLELEHVELSGNGGIHNYAANPSFERPIEKSDLNKPWSESFINEYVQGLKANANAVREMGFNPVIEGKDEAGNDKKDEYSEISELKYARQAGFTTFCNLSPALAEKAKEYLDIFCFYASLLGDEKSGKKIISDFQSQGKKIYYVGAGSYVTQDYDMMINRFGTGAFLWKSGCDGTFIWTYQRYSGNPYDEFDGPYHDYCLVYPPRKAGGEPVITNAWEGVREGWMDYRYFRTLENEVEKAAKTGKKDIARKGAMIVNFLKKAIPWYNEFTTMSFDSATANDLRWLAAWATMKFQNESLNGNNLNTINNIDLSISAQKPEKENKTEKMTFISATEKAPELDGKLDDEIWKTAAVINQFYDYMNPQVKASNNTNVFMLHDTENIYLGFRCFEKDMHALKASEKKHDDNIFADDCIEMFFDTSNSSCNYFQLCFNAAASKFDLKGSGSRNTSSSIFAVDYTKEKVRDTAWNGDWSVKTSRHADRWEAEVKIPFKTIGRSNDVWGILFGRGRKAGTPETTSSKSIGYFDQPEFFSRALLSGGRDGHTVLKKWQIDDFKFGPETSEMLFSGSDSLNVKTTVTEKDGKHRDLNFQTASGRAEVTCDINGNSTRLDIDVTSANRDNIFTFKFPLSLKDAIKVTHGKPLFYTGENTAEFSFEINVSRALAQSGSISVSLLSDGNILGKKSVKIGNGAFKISFNTGNLKEGFYSLKFDILNEKGNIITSSLYDFAVIPYFINKTK